LIFSVLEDNPPPVSPSLGKGGGMFFERGLRPLSLRSPCWEVDIIALNPSFRKGDNGWG